MKFKLILLALIKSAKILDATGVEQLEKLEEGADIPQELADKINQGITAHLENVATEAAKAAKDEAHGRGTREALAKIERQVKEKYGVESTKVGIELIDEVITERVNGVSKGDPAKMTEEQLLKLPAVAAINDKLVKATNELASITTKATELEQFKTQAEQREFQSTIVTEALSKFKALNPALPDDAEKAEKQTRLFQKAILDGKYKVEEVDGKKVIFPVDNEGNYITNSHKARITFDDHVKGVTEEYFGITQQGKKSGAGNDNNQGGGQGAGGASKFTGVLNTTADVKKAVSEAKTDEERANIMNAWDEKQKNS
jgi:hypothetical protein